MAEVNWQTAEAVLFDKTREALRVFSKKYPEDKCSFFAYRTDYYYGRVWLCMDTAINAQQQAKQNNDKIRASRRMLFGRDRGWESARYYLTFHAERVLTYSYSSGFFLYDEFAELQFSDWENYCRSDGYDEQYHFEGRVIVLFWKVLERLVEAGAFGELKLASPFRTGFEFHDNDLGLVVMQILNWPDQR